MNLTVKMTTTMMKTISPSFAPFPGNSALFSFSDFQLSTIFFISRCSSLAAVNDKHVKVKVGLSIPKPSPTQLEKLVIDKCKSRSLKLDEALGFFDSMISQRPLPSIRAFNYLLGALAKMKHYSVVVSMCKQMMGCQEMQPDICTMNIFMNCYCNLKQADCCLSVLALILKLGLQPDPYTMNYLLLGLINESKIDEAMKLFLRIVQKGYPCNAHTCNIIISGLCKSGYTRYALQILLKGMIGSPSLEPNVVTYNTIIDGFCKEGSCKQGMMEKAAHVLGLMKQKGANPNEITYRTMINGYCLRGEIDKAEGVLNLMVRKGFPPSLGICKTLVNAYSKGKSKDEVSRYIEEMIQKGMIPDYVAHKMLAGEDLTNSKECIVEPCSSPGSGAPA